MIAREALERHRAGFEPPAPGSLELDFGGEYQFRLDGEKHLWNPETIVKLQHAVVAERSEDCTPSTPRRSTTRAAT